MYDCPYCRQELTAFAFYCPRCRRPVGELHVEGDMLTVWWLDAGGEQAARWGLKTLKRGAEDLNLVGVAPERPTADNLAFKLRARLDQGSELVFERSAVEVFAVVSEQEMQEWQIQ
ncbi:MAG TPA: hypothetical protein VF546_23150 [Pyrinomonadaceae bacterium]|jgi:hypothetical protein